MMHLKKLQVISRQLLVGIPKHLARDMGFQRGDYVVVRKLSSTKLEVALLGNALTDLRTLRRRAAREDPPVA